MNTVSTVLEDSILDELEPEEVLENLVTELNDKLGVEVLLQKRSLLP